MQPDTMVPGLFIVDPVRGNILSKDDIGSGNKSGLILLVVAAITAVGATVALGFTAFAFPAQGISNWFLSLMVLLCLFLLASLVVCIWTVRNDPEPPVAAMPVVALTALVLAVLSAWVVLNIPSYGYYTLTHCLAHSVCLVPYGSSGTYLDVAAVLFGATFLLVVIAFRQTR